MSKTIKASKSNLLKPQTDQLAPVVEREMALVAVSPAHSS